jgi:predicted permease
VIGVLPPAFRYTYPLETEAWTMLPWSRVTGDGVGYETVARLAGDVSFAAANARVAAMPMTAEASTGRPEDRLTLHFVLEPITKWVLDEARPSLWLLGGVAALLLLIACATVASALFVRVAERQQELALRAAIGAGRGRLVRQLLTEGALLSVVAAAMGSLLAALAAPLLRAVVPASVPRAADIGVNLWIIAFFAAAAGVATIAAALAPAWRGARFDVVSMLKGSTRGASADLATARWRRTLVGLQCALCTALFLAAALLLVSFWRLSHMPLGFDGERVLAVELNPMADKYRVTHSAGSQTSSPGVLALQEQLSTRLRAVPGIQDVGLTSAIPFNGFDFMRYFHPMGAPDQELPGNARFVDPGFFSVLDIPVVRGRLITANDTVGSPRVIVISEAFARRMFGSEDPIGKFINPDEPLEVVGVVGDLRYRTFDSDPYPAVYLPINQSQTLSVCVVAKLSPGAGNLEPMIRSAIKAVDPQLPALSVKTLDEILSTSVAERRFYATSTTALASLALVLTVAGLVVVISRAVVERRREMAIRSALGANASALIGAVVRQGLAPVVIGIAGGLGAVFAAAAFLRQFLFHTAPSDVSLVAGVALTVLLVAIVAALIPARRAARVSTAAVLRAE